MKEEWKDIPGLGGIYQASTMGQIRAIDRKVYNYIKPGRILKPQLNTTGYYIVNVVANGIREKHAYIHRLVASTFIPNPQNYAQVNHKDSNKLNNNIDNLECVSPQQNIQHFRQSKLAIKYDKKKERTLLNKSLNYILRHREAVIVLYAEGFNIEEVSKKLGLGRDRVTDILRIYDRV